MHQKKEMQESGFSRRQPYPRRAQARLGRWTDLQHYANEIRPRLDGRYSSKMPSVFVRTGEPL